MQTRCSSTTPASRRPVCSPPSSKADLAFTMHILHWLAVNGTAAIVEFPGVLYRGGAEAKIRKYLVDNNYVDAVIQLPPDLFFGTSIATCIIVLKKSKADNNILFIDASSHFTRQGNKNKLTADHQKAILGAFTGRADIPHVAALVDHATVAANGYNIAVSPYVDAKDTREVVDISELERRDRPHRHAPVRAPHADRRHRRRPHRRTLPPRGRVRPNQPAPRCEGRLHAFEVPTRPRGRTARSPGFAWRTCGRTA